MKLPVQEVPSPENPSLHSHVYEPIQFSHLAFVLQGLEIHSLMSKIFNKIFIKIEHFLRMFISIITFTKNKSLLSILYSLLIKQYGQL